MPEYLNIAVAKSWMVSIPIKTAKQKEAAEKVSQGLIGAQVFVILEPKARKTP